MHTSLIQVLQLFNIRKSTLFSLFFDILFTISKALVIALVKTIFYSYLQPLLCAVNICYDLPGTYLPALNLTCAPNSPENAEFSKNTALTYSIMPIYTF